MTCRGIRPDGDECTCADEFTIDGLCAVCAAPESAALVPVGSTDLMAQPELDALYEALPPKAQAFISAYTKTYTIVKAAKAAGVHRNSHRYWMRHTSGYAELFEVAELDALDHLRNLYADRVENGLKETEYDADGKLKRTRIRQSEGLLKALMIAKDPEFTAEKVGNNIQINIVQVKEGWTDEEDERDWDSTQTARAKELDSIPEAHVIEATDTVEEASVSNEAPVEERRGRSGETFRQRQHRAGWLSKLPND